MIPNLLIVDDEESIRLVLEKHFEARGFNVKTVAEGKEAIDVCRTHSIDLVLQDLRLPDMNGIDVLANIKESSPSTPVIMITGHGDVETAVKAMQKKADNFVLKPIDMATLDALVEKTLESYRTRMEIEYLRQRITKLEGRADRKLVNHPQQAYHAISLLADNASTNVLILGETGTGKGTLARNIHELSERRDMPFIEINCAGLSTNLLESELFGHEKGAFTDAKAFKKGLLEIANGGSVFFDEVAELSLTVQPKLLSVIEQRIFRRLGGTANIEVDVRIMAATNGDLERKVREGAFREDLFFRLNVLPITLPPLRERRDDILPLANQFVQEFNSTLGRAVLGISPEAEAMLYYYHWPGNIRELRNVIERGVLLCDKERIEPGHLPANMKEKSVSAPLEQGSDWSLEAVEKEHVAKVLDACGHNRSKAAKLLGIHRSTLIQKIKKYGIKQ